MTILIKQINNAHVHIKHNDIHTECSADLYWLDTHFYPLNILAISGNPAIRV